MSRKPIDQRLREQLEAKGMAPGQAAGVARAKMVQAGNLKADGTLTGKGEARSAMGAAGRAKDRAAKSSGREAEDFTYNPLNNTARLRRK